MKGTCGIFQTTDLTRRHGPFTIDAWGNLTKETGIAGKTYSEGLNTSANSNNQLTSFVYDAAGNMTSNSPSTYKYDAENRLVTTAGYTYYYDGDGNRVAKLNGSASTIYWRNLGGETLLESSVTGTRLARLDVAGLSPLLRSKSLWFSIKGTTC